MSLRRSEPSRTARNRFRPRLDVLEDRSVPSTIVVATTADSGAGSLRAAIDLANGTSEADTITFRLGPTDPGRFYYLDDFHPGEVTVGNAIQVISTTTTPTDDDHLPGIDLDWPHSWWSIRPLTPLPEVTQPITIDGTTQPPGRPNEAPELSSLYLRVELDGRFAGAADGLLISGGTSKVLGLAINRFGASGVHLQGTGGNVVERNFLGTDISGTLDVGNAANGVFITGGSGNVIGGLTDRPGTGNGNVISGNDDNGISVFWDRIVPRIEGTVVQGNVVGLNAVGKKPLGNTHAGFRTADSGGLIGGTDPMARNIISSNESGVLLSNSGSDRGVVIHGNFIGTDISGRAPRGNTGAGVTVGSAPGTRVGGAEFGAGNVISGNRIGVFIHGISHPTIDGRYNCVVQGNVIGLDVTESVRLDNNDGVVIHNSDNLIGGLTDNAGHGRGNIISGNTQNGISVVRVRDPLSPPVVGTVVQGNLIGLNGSGTAAVRNGLAGFRTTDAGAQVGGAETRARNIISGNQYGVLLSNSGSDYGARIQGNFIGLDIAGRFAVPNSSIGVDVGSAPGTYVGGMMPGEGNVISGNFTGVFIAGISHRVIDGLYNCVVQGNTIGLDVTGTVPVANNEGVLIKNNDNLIGGTTPTPGHGRGNIISGNTVNGVSVVRDRPLPGGPAVPPVEGTVVQGNIIGLSGSGTVRLGNGLAGFRTFDAGALVGGALAEARNIISGNQYGVLLSNSGTNYGTRIYGNSIGTDITGNFDLGNDADGVNVGSAPGTHVGGVNPGEGNVISGNRTGVFINGISHPVIGVIGGFYNCLVRGNLIGLSADGRAAVGNTTGVLVINSDNLIGGESEFARNVISGNTGTGIHIRHAATTGNRVSRNVIGYDVTGLRPLGNLADGILISDGAAANAIFWNRIGFNGRDGISLENGDNNSILLNGSVGNGRDGIRADALSTGNTIALNFMFFNGEHDRHDDSVGAGTRGTANFWLADLFDTSSF